MFVVRSTETGKYLKVGPTWSREWSDNLQEARTYPSTGAARNSGSSTRWGKEPPPFEVVPVQITLA